MHVSGLANKRFSSFSFLSPEDVGNALAVRKAWKQLLDQPEVWNNQLKMQGYASIEDLKSYLERWPDSLISLVTEYAPGMFFDKKIFAAPISNAIHCSDYATYFGASVITRIPRPPRMRWENNQPDPDDPHRKIEETHVWACVPDRLLINNIATIPSLEVIENLAKAPITGFAAQLMNGTDEISQEQRRAAVGRGGWYLRSKRVMQGTKNLTYNEQLDVASRKGYGPLSGPIVILIDLLWHVKTKELLLNNSTITTSLTVGPRQGHWVVSVCAPGTLRIIDYRADIANPDVGLVGQRFFMSADKTGVKTGTTRRTIRRCILL